MSAAKRTLEGKVAIITGASKLNGIGAAAALLLAEQGANVSLIAEETLLSLQMSPYMKLTQVQILIHYSSKAGPAEEVAAAVRTHGVKAHIVQSDGSARDFGTKLVNEALSAFGTGAIDIVVNNAGTAVVSADTAAVDFDSWDAVFHVNVRGPFALIQAALPYMKSGGRIINIGSVIAQLGHSMLPVYGASKGALNALTVAMAGELAQKGITINVVSPGPISTDLSMKGSPIAVRLEANQHIKREGTAREVASAIAYLASPDASYITGQIVPVDGGIWLP